MALDVYLLGGPCHGGVSPKMEYVADVLNVNVDVDVSVTYRYCPIPREQISDRHAVLFVYDPTESWHVTGN